MQDEQLHKIFTFWLRAMLTDEKHRATLHTLLQQAELPVIELENNHQ